MFGLFCLLAAFVSVVIEANASIFAFVLQVLVSCDEDACYSGA